MADMMDTLKQVLGDDAEDKIKSVLSSLSGSEGESKQEDNSGIDIGELIKLKSIAEELSNTNDARSNLLLSLKPFMRSTRQKGIDNAIRLLSLSKLGGLFQ
ncbi:MAG: hypothetical protein UIM24_06480 [Clostridia bacterium]|nr:hypothetical protein [Clostridia bacterium]